MREHVEEMTKIDGVLGVRCTSGVPSENLQDGERSNRRGVDDEVGADSCSIAVLGGLTQASDVENRVRELEHAVSCDISEGNEVDLNASGQEFVLGLSDAV